MARQLTLLLRGLLFVTALFGFLSPVLSLADTTAQDNDTGANKSLQQDENHWRLRFNVSRFNSSNDSIHTSARDYHGRLDIGAGAGFQAEYRASPRLGVELGLLAAGGIQVSGGHSRHHHGGFGLSGFVPISLGLNFHLTPARAADLYVGPQIALVAYGTEYDWWPSGHGNSTQSDWAWGLVTGLDVPLGRRGWLFNINLRYLATSIRQSRGDFFIGGDFDPVIFSLGFGYAF